MTGFRRIVLVFAAIGVSCAASAAAQELLPSATPTVAIMEFDFAAVHQWWAVELEIGRGIADLFADGLVNDGGYRVVERRFLQAILAEQDLAADPDRSDSSNANLVRAGKLVGAHYLVVGSVTRFGTESETAGGGGGLVGRALGLGLLGREKGKAVVGMTARLVDTSTGVVIASVTSEATSSRSGLLLGGLTLKGFAGFSMRSSGFRETILGEATERAVRQLVEQLVAAKSRVARQSSITRPL